MARSVTDWLTAVAMISVLVGCAPKDSDEKNTDSSVAAAAGGDVARSAKIPVTSASDEARSLYVKGRDLSEQLRNQDARPLFEQAVAKDSTFALAHYNLALTSPTGKEFLQHLGHAVAHSSKASEGEQLLIRSLEAQAKADPAKSLQLTEEIVAKYPQDERARFNLGNAYNGRQQYDKAVAEYKKAIEINPNYSPAYNSLGYTYRPMGNNAEAEQAFKKYIELVPNDPNPYDSYAELLMKMGRFDESIAQYRKALAIDPRFGASQIGVASNLMLQGKHDEAIAEAQKLYDAARDDGDRRTAMFAQVVIDADRGRTAQALQRMERLYALGAKSADTGAMANDAATIGDILLDAGRAAEAQKRYAQSLALIMGSGFPAEVKEDATLGDHYNKARVALATNDLATARTEADAYLKGSEARQNDFRVRQAHQVAGMIAQKEKKFDEAIAHYAKANQQDPYVIYMTALAHQAKGDTAKAKELSLRAADDNSLPALNYAFVRTKARKMAQ